MSEYTEWYFRVYVLVRLLRREYSTCDGFMPNRGCPQQECAMRYRKMGFLDS